MFCILVFIVCIWIFFMYTFCSLYFSYVVQRLINVFSINGFWFWFVWSLNKQRPSVNNKVWEPRNPTYTQTSTTHCGFKVIHCLKIIFYTDWLNPVNKRFMHAAFKLNTIPLYLTTRHPQLNIETLEYNIYRIMHITNF